MLGLGLGRFVCREQVAQLLSADRLLGQEDLRRAQQHLVALGQDLRGAVALLVDDAADLVVDRARGLFAVLAAERTSRRRLQHEGAPILLEADLADPRAHPEGLHHAARDVGRLAQIVVRAGRDLVVDAAPRRRARPSSVATLSLSSLSVIRKRSSVGACSV